MKVRRWSPPSRGIRACAPVGIAALFLPVVLSCLGCGPALRPPAAAASSGASSAAPSGGSLLSPGKALVQAHDAIASKNLSKALHFYELALENSKKNDDRRAEALFGSGMLLIDSDPGVRDIDRGRARMEELKELYPGESLHVGAIVALDLIAENARLQSEAQKLRDDGAKAEESWKKEKEDLQERIKTSAKETQTFAEEAAKQRKATEDLRSTVAAKDAEAAILKATLVAKDEALTKALRKVKGALVRQGVDSPAGSNGDAGRTGGTESTGKNGSPEGTGATGATKAPASASGEETPK